MVRNIWLALFTAAVFGIVYPPIPGSAQTHLDLGSRAPLLSGYDTQGNFQQLDDYLGKWVFIDFWASWCSPCVDKLPEIIQLKNDLRNRGDFEVLSVSLDDNSSYDDMLSVVRRYGFNFPVVFDGQGWRSSTARLWDIKSIPATFLINPQGQVIARDIHPSQVLESLPKLVSPAYLPIQMSSRDNLLLHSPSSGMNNFRDLLIDLEMQDDIPMVSRYQVYVISTCAGQGRQTSQYEARFDLSINVDAADAGLPYYVDIRKTTGEKYQTGDPQVSNTTGVPDMSAVVDLARRKLQFVVPVPSCSHDVKYSLSVFDPQLNQYVKNGLTTVDTSM